MNDQVQDEYQNCGELVDITPWNEYMPICYHCATEFLPEQIALIALHGENRRTAMPALEETLKKFEVAYWKEATRRMASLKPDDDDEEDAAASVDEPKGPYSRYFTIHENPTDGTQAKR